MKYYIGFPISFNCNLRCSYCFNKSFYDYIDDGIGVDKWRDKRTFSFQDYRDWRDQHLSDATDIIMHLYGGEPFCKQNENDVFQIINFADKERIDILSNGICDISVIDKLEKYKNKFNRIGFTYHRKIMEGSSELNKIFEANVKKVQHFGIPVYVKELYIKELRDVIISNKRNWLSQGIEFKIQDFKGLGGRSYDEYSKYTPLDMLIIDNEYKHPNSCSCIHGYKNLFIRGFDMKDNGTNGTDIIACWQDPSVVGNIKENWFDSNYIIGLNKEGHREVKNVKKIYRGTYKKDLPLLNKP